MELLTGPTFKFVSPSTPTICSAWSGHDSVFPIHSKPRAKSASTARSESQGLQHIRLSSLSLASRLSAYPLGISRACCASAHPTHRIALRRCDPRPARSVSLSVQSQSIGALSISRKRMGPASVEYRFEHVVRRVSLFAPPLCPFNWPHRWARIASFRRSWLLLICTLRRGMKCSCGLHRRERRLHRPSHCRISRMVAVGCDGFRGNETMRQHSALFRRCALAQFARVSMLRLHTQV